MILSGTGTYAGNTIVNGGSLFVNGGVAGTSSGTGNGLVTVNNSGTLLGGTGVINGAVTINTGGAITPGTLGTGGLVTLANVGTLTTGALTLTNGSIFHIDISNPASFDQLISSGAVALGGATLEVNIASGLAFTPGEVLTLIDNNSGTAIGGTFTGLSQGASFSANGYQFTVDYTNGLGGDFALVVVPEPATFFGGAMLVAVIVWRQRRHFGKRSFAKAIRLG